MNKSLNNTPILVLTGVSCVGKTTTAYEIIQRNSIFRRVSELDIIRAILRTNVSEMKSYGYITEEQVSKRYEALFSSLTFSDYGCAKKQSEILLPYVKEIILRQQRRKIPTVIEGAGIVPSTYFPNNVPLEWLNEYVIFVNLHLASEQEHLVRRYSRCLERNYEYNKSTNQSIVNNIRENKSQVLHSETSVLSKKISNVFSVDVTGLSSKEVSEHIIELLDNYLSSLQ